MIIAVIGIIAKTLTKATDQHPRLLFLPIMWSRPRMLCSIPSPATSCRGTLPVWPAAMLRTPAPGLLLRQKMKEGAVQTDGPFVCINPDSNDHFTSSMSPGRQVFSNHGSRGP